MPPQTEVDQTEVDQAEVDQTEVDQTEVDQTEVDDESRTAGRTPRRQEAHLGAASQALTLVALLGVPVPEAVE